MEKNDEANHEDCCSTFAIEGFNDVKPCIGCESASTCELVVPMFSEEQNKYRLCSM